MKRTVLFSRIVVLAGMLAWLTPWNGETTQAQQTADRTPEEEANLKHLAGWFDVHGSKRVSEWPNYAAPEFICHCPGLEDGLPSLIRVDGPRPQYKMWQIVNMADGNFIISKHLYYGRQIQTAPNDPSMKVSALGIEMYRMRNGRQYEHWDRNVSLPLGIVSIQPDVKARSAAETRNLEFVLNYWNNVYLPLKVDQLKDFVAADYTEHDPTFSTTGFPGFVAKLTADRQKHPGGLAPVHLVATLVDSDRVALYKVASVQPRGPNHLATRPALYASMSLEMFRVRDGKIVEHWGDFIRPVE